MLFSALLLSTCALAEEGKATFYWNYDFDASGVVNDAVNNILAFQRENEQNAAVDQSKMVGSGNAALAGKVAFAHSGETFAVSTKEAGLKKAVSIHKNANGEYAEITNLLDDANPNKYLEDALMPSDAESRCAFYDFIRDRFDFPIMSDIDSCIMEKEFFFDSNFHLNAAGMMHYTVNLVEDIKNQLGNTRKTEIILPEKPIKPDPSIVGEGDNACADCFTYIKDGNYYIIDGLTEKGQESASLTIPYQVNGLYVKRFLPDVFAGNKKVEEITIQGNITSIPNHSFKGCTMLKKVILTHEKPSEISAGYGLLDGTNAKIYIQNAYVNPFTNDYSWGYYEQKIVGY